MPKEWDENKEKLSEYHETRRAYYEERATTFLMRAQILKRDGDPEK